MPLHSLLAAVQTADTVVTIQVRDGLGTTAAIAQIALAVVFVLLLGALFLLLIQLRGIQRTVAEIGGRLEVRAEPLLDRGKEVAANVEFITGSLRADVQRVSESVKSVSDRLQKASDRMERRVEDFNALMEVVQSEAEDLFIGSAAAVRGVRAGARALRRDGSRADDLRAAEETPTVPPHTSGTDEVEPSDGAPAPAPGGIASALPPPGER